MNVRGLPLVLLALALPGMGCDTQTCTAAGCSNGASIGIRTAEDIPLEGAIEIVLDLDGEIWSISCPSAGDACEAAVDTDSALAIWPHRGQTGMVIEISANERGDMPDAFDLQVSLDGEQVIDEVGTFEYETSAPNGPDCGPICVNGGVVFTVEG